MYDRDRDFRYTAYLNITLLVYRFSRTNLGTQKTILGRNLISLLSRPLLKWNILVGSLEGWAGRKALYMTKKSLKFVVLLLRNVYTLTVLGPTASYSGEL